MGIATGIGKNNIQLEDIITSFSYLHTINNSLFHIQEAMGQAPTEDELFQMISEVDDNMSGSIDFGEFLKVVESQKNRAENLDDENDMVDAFVACGGQADKSGHVKSKYYYYEAGVVVVVH